MQNRDELSRRKFLGLSVASGAGLGLGAFAGRGDASAQLNYDQDVAIVGAGLSGLVAARELLNAGIKSVVVIEARDRVGGRTINHDIGGGRVAEGGGQWVGPTQKAILSLCEELGVATFPTFLDGKIVFRMGGQRMLLPYEMAVGDSQSAAARKVDELAQTVPLNAPWKAGRAAEWDAMTLADWVEENVPNQSERSTFDTAAALTLSTTPEQLSFLYFLYYVHSAGSLHDLESMEGGAQDSRIVGGSQILSIKMAEALGNKVMLQAPVSKISQDATGVEIGTERGTVRAKHVIMALMPGSCLRMQFDPALPESRVKLQEAWPAVANAIKYNVVYDTPFWRADGLNGMSMSESSPVGFTTDNSPPDGSLGVIAILTSADSLPLEAPDRRRRVIEELAAIFGDKAKTPTGFHEMDWHGERWSGGCVSPLAPGVLTRYGAALRPSIGRIHWAGTETSERWTGYMDGAVRAGKHSAIRVAKVLAAS